MKPSMTFRKLMPFLVISGGILAVLLAGVLGCQRRLYYFPRPYTPMELQTAQAYSRAIDFDTDAGRQRAFYLPPDMASNRAPEFLWVMFTGNGGRALEWVPIIEAYNTPGTAFLLVDYPGFGASEGRTTRPNIDESARAALSALSRELGTTGDEPPCPYGIIGHSMGAAAALDLAVASHPRAVLLLAPFTSLTDMGARFVGTPLNSLILDRFDNDARLADLADSPTRPAVAILHGDKDEVIPVLMGRALANGREPWVHYTELKGGNHNGILFTHRNQLYAAMQRLQNGA